MRKALHYLFPIAAMCICLVGSSRAQAPQLAVCKEGSCYMSESDYRQLQAFAQRLREYAQNAQRVDEEKEVFIMRLRSSLDSCVMQRDGHKGGWNR